MKIHREFVDGSRYQFDFGLCSLDKGWSQMDTNQDAPYYGTWAHPTAYKLCSYTEGDVTVTECDGEIEFVGAVREWLEWAKGMGYNPRIDAHGQREAWEALGFEIGEHGLIRVAPC